MSDDPEAKALLERWNEAIDDCQGELREGELEDIRNFQGPQDVLANLRERFEQSAEGKLKRIVSQISPFFEELQKVLLLLTVVMPSVSKSLALVSGGAYLTVKKCAEFDSASERIVDILMLVKHQLWLFHYYSENLKQENCREGLIRMFIALIRFWVTSIRFLHRTPRDRTGDSTLADRWPTLQQNFRSSLQEIEDAVKTIEKLQNMEASRWAKQTAKARAEIIEHLPNDKLSNAVFPCYDVHTADKDFRGRSREAARLRECLEKGGKSVSQVVVISGLGGVGKSSLALNACHSLKSGNVYEAIFWINAENEDVIRESFTRMVLKLDLKGASSKSDKDRNFMLAENWLEKAGRSWLLVYDNVEEFDLLHRYLPPDKGTVIITTRFPTVSFGLSGQPMRLELRKMTAIESLDLFEYIRRQRHPTAGTKDEAPKIKELLEMVDGLPLGIRQMASFISSKKITIAKFRELYTRMARSILDSKLPTSLHTLSTLWNVQFEDIRDSDAAKLLGLLSLCSPEKIPKELFDVANFSGNEPTSQISFCTDYEKVENAVTCLQDKALIEIEDGGDLLSLHRLTQEAFIYSVNGLAVFLTMAGQNPSWKTGTFARAVKPLEPLMVCDSFVHLLKRASWYLQEIGEIKESLELARLGIDICDDKTNRNDVVDGEHYSTKAINIREDRLSPNDVDVAISYFNRANALLNQGNFEECLGHHAISDQIWVDLGLDNDIYRGLSYMNQGRAYSLRGDKDLAASYYCKAEQVFSDFPNKWLSVALEFSWGILYMNQDDLLTALGKFQSALNLAEQFLSTRILVSAIHYKLGVLYMKLNWSINETRKHLESAMAIAVHHEREAEVARIGRQLAIAIRRDPKASKEDLAEADKHERLATETRERLWKRTEPHLPTRSWDENEQHDWLIAAYYR